MEIDTLILPLVEHNPKWKAMIENATGQPVNYVMKSLSEFLDKIKSGPGIQNLEAEKQNMFNYLYEAGIKMGFTDWESEIAAAGHAGYSPVDIAISFSRNRGWDATAEEIENIARNLAPRFNAKAEKFGVIQTKKEESGIPKTEPKTTGGEPPWRNKSHGGNVVNPLNDLKQTDDNK